MVKEHAVAQEVTKVSRTQVTVSGIEAVLTPEGDVVFTVPSTPLTEMNAPTFTNEFYDWARSNKIPDMAMEMAHKGVMDSIQKGCAMSYIADHIKT